MKNYSIRLATGALAASALMLSGVLPVSAVQQPSPNVRPDVAADSGFVTEAAQAGLAEVQGSKLALQKSQDSAVRDFAQRMVADHGKANEKLKAIARANNLKVPGEPSDDQKKRLESLGQLSGDKFNERYSDCFGVSAHEMAINLFEREAQSGSAPALRTFAQQTLPTLREHLQMARDLKTKMSAGHGNVHSSGKPS